MEKSYRVSLAKFGAHLFQDEKKRLQTLYRMPTKYNKLPPEAILQGLELLGVYSPSRPEGVAELPLWLGMKDVHKSVRKSLKKNKGVKINDMFCLPLYEELYAAADLQACFKKVQEQTMALAAHVELLSSIASAHTSGSIHYESLQGPHTLKNISEQLDKIHEDIGLAASEFGFQDSSQSGNVNSILVTNSITDIMNDYASLSDDYSMGTVRHRLRPLPNLPPTCLPQQQTNSEKLLRKAIQAPPHIQLQPAADERRFRAESPPPFLSRITHSPSFQLPVRNDFVHRRSPAAPPARATPPQLPSRALSRPPPVGPKPSAKQTGSTPPGIPPKINKQG